MRDGRIDVRADVLKSIERELVEQLTLDERAALEAATGDMGNKPDAVKLGWLKMRTKESWTKQRYTSAIGRALGKLRKMVEERKPEGSAS
jgi:hypothetical protein